MISQITENLYISGIEEAYEADKSDFQQVITVCQDNIESNVGCRYSHFNMADGEAKGYGGRFDDGVFKEAAEELLEALEKDRKTLLHCHVGKSRSVSVAIAVLSVKNDIPFHTARSIVEAGRKQAHPKQDLLEKGKEYVKNKDKGEVVYDS